MRTRTFVRACASDLISKRGRKDWYVFYETCVYSLNCNDDLTIPQRHDSIRDKYFILFLIMKTLKSTLK